MRPRADSIVVNPHKWLFTPVDCSLLYCARPNALVRAFSIVPEYLSSAGQSESRDLMDFGVSLGRRFRSLKLWFVLRAFGREGILARLRHHVAMAKDFEKSLEHASDWEVVAPVHFSTVAFRYAPDGVDAERLGCLQTQRCARAADVGCAGNQRNSAVLAQIHRRARFTADVEPEA